MSIGSLLLAGIVLLGGGVCIGLLLTTTTQRNQSGLGTREKEESGLIVNPSTRYFTLRIPISLSRINVSEVRISVHLIDGTLRRFTWRPLVQASSGRS